MLRYKRSFFQAVYGQSEQVWFFDEMIKMGCQGGGFGGTPLHFRLASEQREGRDAVVNHLSSFHGLSRAGSLIGNDYLLRGHGDDTSRDAAVRRCRTVTVSPGPLLRVEGQTLSIRCDVSEYEGPREQDFEWTLTRGSEKLNVISTFDPAFSHKSLKERIRSGDVSISRLADNIVELRIREAQINDGATYQCITPSTDSVMRGIYEASVLLEVIPNSLVVTPQPLSPVVPEGRSVRLPCNVSRNFTEGVYTSVSWSLKKPWSLEQDLLSCGPDLSVTVGEGYRERYMDGGMRLEMGNGNGISHGLVLSSAAPEDQGVFVCTVRLWTREQGSWRRIQEKSVEMGEVTVKPASSLVSVQLHENSSLSSGDTLLLTCSVFSESLIDPDPNLELDLDATWLMNDSLVLAHLSREGVLFNGSETMTLTRLGLWDFQMKIHNLEVSDTGFYSCKVGLWIQRERGRWYKAGEKKSEPVAVRVTKQNPDFTVLLSSSVKPKFSGDPTELECRVTNVSNTRGFRLGVTWLYRNIQPGLMHTIASLDENGTIIPGKNYKSHVEAGFITTMRVEPLLFRLRLLHTTEVDVGEYSCTVMVWSSSRNGNWKKMAELLSSPIKISFANKPPSLSVEARRLSEPPTAGSSFQMICQTDTLNLLPPSTIFSALVHFQEALGSPRLTLASLDPEGILTMEKGLKPELITLVKNQQAEFRFGIQAIQESQRGYYYCQLKAWTLKPGGGWHELSHGDSNTLEVDFTHTDLKRPVPVVASSRHHRRQMLTDLYSGTGPTFALSISSDVSSVYPRETVKIACDISVSGTSYSTDDLSLELQWFLARMRSSSSPSLLASIDRWGIVRKAPRNTTSDLTLEHLEPHRFSLSVQGVQDSDVGEFYCRTTAWIRSMGTGEWRRAHEATSERLCINVKFDVWESMRVPLLYGLCSSVAVGFISLVLGLVCSRCCKTTKPPTPRSRKLMELEMD
ncbi:hypothetical protein DNTS_012485 [Danionella cerebrum]|uniref:Ig-like domain-containing protein n=1 Tax=Danionella cerebrum TaxID=2873325 RepID=A0A553QZX2_9TELE|nr:hypothetical protein DNTS_012485 [Danionella translucida]